MDSEKLFFDPEQHPSDTLKSFKLFCSRFDLRYNATYTDPPATAMESAIQRWKLQHTTATVENPVPTVDQYDTLKDQWKAKDKVRKLLGIFSSQRLYADWEIAQPDENVRNQATWTVFKTTMETHYQPTENPTLSNYQFRSITQLADETFPSYCNRVEREAKSCSFKCAHAACSAENTAIRDQIIIGTINTKIREEALLKSWDLTNLRTEGMKIESACRGEVEISGGAINRVSRYSFSNIKKNKQPENTSNGRTCYNCSEVFKGPAWKHTKEHCKARNHKCKLCSKTGHFPSCCKGYKNVNYSEADQRSDDEELRRIDDISDDVYNVNIFKVNVSKKTVSKPTYTNKAKNQEFSVEVVVNGCITSVTADTGARVSVCGKAEASKWNLLQRMVPTPVRIKPYNSPAVPTEGVARCAVTFGSTSIPVEWFILEGKCEPILSGMAAVNLGIIEFTKTPPIYKPINMINTELNKSHREMIQTILAKRPEVFSTRLGKHKHYQVRLHVDEKVKPIVSPPRPTPYHLKERIGKVVEEMISNDVIEEHPVGDPAPWISNSVIVPKPNGSLRITLDAKNINKAIQSSNLPIPRQEDIKAELAGSEVFSKLDFRNSFWQ